MRPLPKQTCTTITSLSLLGPLGSENRPALPGWPLADSVLPSTSPKTGCAELEGADGPCAPPHPFRPRGITRGTEKQLPLVLAC